jgi:hypothetical protein
MSPAGFEGEFSNSPCTTRLMECRDVPVAETASNGAQFVKHPRGLLLTLVLPYVMSTGLSCVAEWQLPPRRQTRGAARRPLGCDCGIP